MVDGISLRMITGPTLRGLRDIDRRADRATMWALREVGRRVKREARKAAPVYNGGRPDIVPGLLRKSISSSRRLKHEVDGSYSLKIGPRGPRVHLYAAKQEDLTPYMKAGYDAGERDAAELHAKAWTKAMSR